MKTMWLKRLCFMISVAILPAAVLAGNYSFLEYNPIAYFKKEDWRLSEEVTRKALDRNPDGQTSRWANPDGGASGTVTPLKTYKGKSGEVCRKVRFVDRFSRPPLENKWTFNVCQDNAGEWVFNTPRDKAAAGSSATAKPAEPMAAE